MYPSGKHWRHDAIEHHAPGTSLATVWCLPPASRAEHVAWLQSAMDGCVAVGAAVPPCLRPGSCRGQPGRAKTRSFDMSRSAHRHNERKAATAATSSAGAAGLASPTPHFSVRHLHTSECQVIKPTSGSVNLFPLITQQLIHRSHGIGCHLALRQASAQHFLSICCTEVCFLLCLCSSGRPQCPTGIRSDECCFEASRCADCHIGGAHCIPQAGEQKPAAQCYSAIVVLGLPKTLGLSLSLLRACPTVSSTTGLG